jgi:ABC-type Na+ efflux pump permease subunit
MKKIAAYGVVMAIHVSAWLAVIGNEPAWVSSLSFGVLAFDTTVRFAVLYKSWRYL